MEEMVHSVVTCVLNLLNSTTVPSRRSLLMSR